MLSVIRSCFVAENIYVYSRGLVHLAVLINRLDNVSAELAHLVKRGHVCERRVLIEVNFLFLYLLAVAVTYLRRALHAIGHILTIVFLIAHHIFMIVHNEVSIFILVDHAALHFGAHV